MDNITHNTIITLVREFWPITWALAVVVIGAGLLIAYRVHTLKVRVDKDGDTEIVIQTTHTLHEE